jgi:hypothetical protein
VLLVVAPLAALADPLPVAPGSPPTDGGAAATSPSVAVAAAGPEAKRAAAARGLVSRWLATQNAADFATYSALYAPRFQGVRRSGERTVRLDRAGWLRDRQRMFRKAQRVSVAEVQVEPGSPEAIDVGFTQFYRSGSYEDEGPKHLRLVAGPDGALRIASEELLFSRRRPALGRAFLVSRGRLVLQVSPPRGLGVGAIERSNVNGSFSATQAVDPGRLPPGLATLPGRMVRVVGLGPGRDREASHCRVVGPIVLLYEGETGHDDDKARTVPDLDLIEDGRRTLVAGLEGPGCYEGRAWPEDAPLPERFAGEVPEPEWDERALAALAAAGDRLPAGIPVKPAELARCWLAGMRRFHAREGDAAVDLLLYSAVCRATGDPSGARSAVTIWSVFAIDGDRLALRDAGVDAQWEFGVERATAADLNGDGRLDFIGGSVRQGYRSDEFRLRGGGWERALFSSPAGYAIVPTVPPPIPIITWDYDPGC